MEVKEKYTATVRTAGEVEPAARKLLLQVADKERLFSIVADTEKGSDFPTTLYLVYADETPRNNQEDYSRLTLPKVYTMKGEDSYSLYLLTDREKLPVYYRSLLNEGTILPLLKPTVKPEKALPAEALLTKDGQELIDSLDVGGKVTDWQHERRLSLAAPSLRLAALFTVYKKDIPEAKYNKWLKAALGELESDTYEDGVGDNEIAIASVTGKDTSTEEKFLTAVAEYIGAPVPGKYKRELIHGYRFYKSLRFIDWLYYELLRTEDYSYVVSIAPEAAKTVGYKEEYLREITSDGKDVPGASAVKCSLYKYLRHYLAFGKHFDGITDTRLAEYLNVDKSTFQEIVNKSKEYRHTYFLL